MSINRFALLIPAFLVLILIFWIRPYYGFMDDANLLEMARHVSWFQLPEFIWRVGSGDIDSGFIRFLHPLHFWILYTLGAKNPVILFALAWGVSVAALVAFSKAITQFIEGAEKLFPFVLLGTFCFPWTYDLFIHPSLQEKLLLGVAALTTYWMARRFVLSRWTEFCVAVPALLFLGMISKSQILVFYPAWALWVLFLTKNKAPLTLKQSTFLGFLFLSAAILIWVAQNGQYTGGMRLDKMLAQLFSPKYLFLEAFVLLSTLDSILIARQSRSLKQGIRHWIPGTVVGSFLLIFLQWYPAGYLFSLITPCLAMILVLWLQKTRIFQKYQNALLVLLLILATGISGFRSYGYFNKLASIRELISDPQFRQWAQDAETPLAVPCPEAASSLDYFLLQEYGLKTLITPRYLDAAPSGAYRLILDEKLCADRSSVLGQFAHTLILSPRGAHAFQVYLVVLAKNHTLYMQPSYSKTPKTQD